MNTDLYLNRFVSDWQMETHPNSEGHLLDQLSVYFFFCFFYFKNKQKHTEDVPLLFIDI